MTLPARWLAPDSISDAIIHVQQANQVLPEERFLMTSPIRASTDAYLRLQSSDYNAARRPRLPGR